MEPEVVRSIETIGGLNKKNFLTWLWVILLLLVPIVLWALPADFFDNGKIALCPSKLFFNIECFGCGMTRAVMHLHHFDMDDAVYFNRGVFLVYPGLVVVWCMWVYKAVKKLGLLFQK